MGYLLAFGGIFLLMFYFYLLFSFMNRKNRSKMSGSVQKPIATQTRQPVRTILSMSMLDLKDRVQKWMESHKFTLKESTAVDANCFQDAFSKADPVFGANYLVMIYHCDDAHPEVPVGLLLQFRDCVRMLAYSKGLAITNGNFPSDTESMFEEAPLQFMHVSALSPV